MLKYKKSQHDSLYTSSETQAQWPHENFLRFREKTKRRFSTFACRPHPKRSHFEINGGWIQRRDVIVFEKFLTRTRQKRCFKKCSLNSAFLRCCLFADRFHRIRVVGRPSVKRKLHFQTKTDTRVFVPTHAFPWIPGSYLRPGLAKAVDTLVAVKSRFLLAFCWNKYRQSDDFHWIVRPGT